MLSWEYCSFVNKMCLKYTIAYPFFFFDPAKISTSLYVLAIYRSKFKLNKFARPT